MKKSSNSRKIRGQTSSAPYENTKELKPTEQACPKDLIAYVNRKSELQIDTYTMKMVYDSIVSTSAGGVIATTFGNSPTLDANWSSMAAAFDEYRTLAVVVEFRPYTYVNQTVTYAPITTVLDLDNSAALTGFTLAAQYSSVKEFGGNKPWKRTMLMSGSENSGYISTASAANNMWVKIYSSGNSASVDIGRITVTHYVQFRGKGI